MKSFYTRVAASLLALGLAAVVSNPVYAQPVDSLAIAREWVVDLATGNFGGALALLDDDSSLIESTSPEGGIVSYSNKAEIAGALQSYSTDNTKIKLVGTPHIVLGTVTWTERRSSDSLGKLGIPSVDVVADAIIQEGKIRSLVYEMTPASAARVERAQAAQQAMLGMPRTGEPGLAPSILYALASVATLALGLAVRAMRRGSTGSN